MARISQYGQDGTLNKLDKVVGTDSATGATKNYTIDSMIGLVNSEDLINVFDGVSYAFKSYEEGSTTPKGIINLNAGAASNAAFSAVNQIYISILDKHGNSIANYLDDTLNSFIRIVQKTNIDTYGVLEVTAVTDHDGGAYKLLTVTPRVNNGNIIVNEEYFVSNYSAVFDQDFSDDSVTEFGDVTDAGSGEIITDAERTSLNNFTANGLVHADVVDNVTSTTTNVPLSANQGKVLKDLIDSLTALLDVDEADKPALDTLREVVNFCQINEATLSSLGISNIAGLQAALDSKQNTEVGKGLSTEDFTTALLTKLNGIAAGAQGNVKSNWNEANTGSDAFIQNKPSDLTNLTLYSVTRLNDVTSAGSGDIITSAERTKLTGIAAGAEVNVQADWNEASSSADSFIQNKPSLAPSNAEQNVQSDFNETDTNSDAFILNKPDLTTKADKATTIEVAGTANEIEITPSGAQDLSTNRTFTVGLPNDVTIGEDLKVNETIELVNSQSTTPTFDNGIYYSTENGHDTLHFRYHGHDLSIDYLTENIPTGILNGGVLSTNTSTTFDVAAGDGVINILNKDNSDPHPEIKKVAWSATTVTHTLGNAGNANQLNTWIYVDSSGNIQQTLTTPSPALWRNNIVLGSVIHSSNVIRFVKTFPRPSYSNGNTFAEFVEIFGPLKKSGHLLTVNSTNTLALDRAAGISFGVGRNYQIDAEEPNLVSDGASTPAFHRYSSTATGFTKDDGTAGAGYTSIDPTKYDNSGTLTTASSGQYTAQRLFHFPNNTNVIVAYYGKAEYASIDEAEKNYLLEDFQEADNTSSQAIYLGALIVKGNATDLGNSSQAKILTGGIFRSLSATNLGGVAADAAINDLTDVNITGVANNEVLKYNGSTGNWENQTDDTIGGSGSGAANKIAIWSGASTLTQDTNLHWDTTNDRLGIGTSSPAYKLDISGSLRATSESTFRSNLLFPDNARIRFGNNSDFNLYRSSTASYISSFDGDILIDNHDDDKDIILRGDDGSGGLTEYLRLDGSTTNAYFLNPGNVGIGTSTPNAALEVHNTLNVGDGTSVTSIGLQRNSANYITATDAAGYLVFRTGGSNERLRITPTGNVGIGTTSPSAKLQVSGDSLFYAPSGVTSVDLTATTINNTEINFGSYGASANVAKITGLSGTLGLSFETNQTERLRIDSSGRVGIGLTNATAKLHVVDTSNSGTNDQIVSGLNSGSPRFKAHIVSYNGVMSLYDSGTNEDVRITSKGGEDSWINNGGNVGIGTDSPNTKIHIESNAADQFKITRTGVASWGLNTYSSGDLVIDNGAERMRINSSGNVGIGTSSPSRPLTVNGDNGTGMIINDATNDKALRFRATGDAFFIESTNNAESSYSNISLEGNVGIGTSSPSSYYAGANNLVIGNNTSESGITIASTTTTDGNIYFSDGTSGSAAYAGYIEYKHSSDDFRIGVAGTERMRINSSGNLGIGTASPESVFHTKQEDATILVQDTNSGFATTEAYIKFSGSNGTGGFRTDIEQTIGYKDNSLVFERAGVETMRIDSSGNVGIGTLSPAEKLEVAGNAILDASNANLKLKSGVAGTKGDIQWTFNSDSTVYASVGIEYDNRGTDGFLIDSGYPITLDTSTYTKFSRNGAEHMRILQNGNVGIGTSSPQGRLDISTATSSDIFNLRIHNLAGDVNQSTGILFNTGFNNVSRGKGGLVYEYNTSTQWNRGDFHFLQRQDATDGVARLSDSVVTIKNNGNVGIGTTSPASLLHTYSSGNNTAIIEGGSSNIVSLEVKDGTNKLALTKYTNSHNEIRSTGNVPLLFKTNGNNERMRITSNGNVGIGTTSPTAAKLQVNGSISSDISGSIGWAVNDNFTWNNFSSTAHYGLTKTTTLVGLSGYYGLGFLTQGSEKMRIEQSGNVGIGTTSPNATLHITDQSSSNTTFRISAQSNDENFAFIRHTDNTANTSRLDFGTTYGYSTEVNAMSIFNGNVGIGTTSPNQKFHIYGNSNYSNLFTVTNNSVGINTQNPSRNGGLHIADSGIKISNSYGNMNFGLLYNHIDLRVPSFTSKFYVSNSSSGPGGPNDAQLAPILVGQIGVKETSPTVAIDAGNATDAIKVPVGTTGERPTGAAGMFRYNSTDGQFEGYTTEWGAIAGGGSGGGGEIVKQTFSGTGSQATFTLANTIADIDNISVYVSGVYQYPSNYTVNGADVTFNTGSIPASGTNNVHVIHTTAVAILTAAVTSVNGQTGAVTFNTYTAPTVYVINTSTTAVANSVYVLTANLTLTLPASPSSGDSIKISNRSGVATCVLARNGSNIMGSASDLTLDTASASFELIYSDATNGWVIIGQ